MEDARPRPSEQLSTEESENFWRNGCNALTSEPHPSSGVQVDAKNPYPSVTVDVPAVGATPDYALPSILRGAAPYAAGVVPGLLRALVDGVDLDGSDLEYKRQLAQLVFRARDLAESRIMRAGYAAISWCMECQYNEIDGSIVHASNCNTGRVFDVIEELQRISLRCRKEAGANALELEQPCAEGASSPRGRELLCFRCGSRARIGRREKH